MRPYLAVIRDAFHEAIASRVLWVLLVVISLVLLALVPVGIVQEAGAYLTEQDLRDRGKLIERIVEQGQAEKPSPGKRIWQRFSPRLREGLEQSPSEGLTRHHRDANFLRELREQLLLVDFYDPVDWKGARLPAEARALEKRGLKMLPKEELARFNRLALDAAYKDLVEPAPGKQIQLTYFHWKTGVPLPIEPEQLFPAINQMLVTALGILLGAFGVFIAVLVTASMIPNTFEAGSVDLLLSKPVSRSGLFLAKFVGGCVFIAINAAYFITGLWLILGLRLGLWNERLLWAIPLYVFLFAIYYGVSALAGLVWRNAIVSVVIAVLFWLMCFVMGTAVNFIEQLSLNPRRLVHVVQAGETLIAADQNDVFAWDDKNHQWREIFAGGTASGQPAFVNVARMAGPVYDAAGERILAFRTPLPGLEQFAPVNRLLLGKRADDWRRVEGVTLPNGSAGLFLDAEGQAIIAASDGLHAVRGDSAARQQEINFFGLRMPLPETRGGVVRIGPQVRLRRLVSSAMDQARGLIALFDGSKLVLLKLPSPGDKPPADELRELELAKPLSGQVAFAGGSVWLATGGGEVRRYDLELKPGETIDAQIDSTPLAAMASPDGRYLAVLFQNSRLWLYDTKTGQPADFRIAGQGDISAVAFDGERLLVADRITRVTRYDLAQGTLVDQHSGEQPAVERVYRYILHPLYTIFPKPGELNETVSHVLRADDAKIAGPRLDDNQAARPVQVEIWGPVWSNLLFLAVVLAISCLYVQRRDF